MPLALRCPFADWRPLATRQTEPSIDPRIMVFHTMVGTLRGTDTYFRTGNGTGYGGTESHFGVGGPADGDALDGALWQWQDTAHQADAQADGNPYCVSVETSDGGKPETPLSPRQLAALVKLGAWFCVGTGAPPLLVTSPAGRGFGYHRLFAAWNPNGHTCPGDTRARQIVNVVVPAIQEALMALDPADVDSIAEAVWSHDVREGDVTLRSWVALRDVYDRTAALRSDLSAVKAELDAVQAAVADVYGALGDVRTKVNQLAAASGSDPDLLASKVADLIAQRLAT